MVRVRNTKEPSVTGAQLRRRRVVGKLINRRIGPILLLSLCYNQLHNCSPINTSEYKESNKTKITNTKIYTYK